MARPKKQTVEYFPHFCGHKKTMFILEQKYGNDGYAFWFKLLEMLGSYEGHVIDLSNAADWEFLQSKTRLSEDTCHEILDLLAKLDAIDPELWEQKIVWSDNFVNGLTPVYSNRKAEIPLRPSFYGQKPTTDELLLEENHKGSKGSKGSKVEEVTEGNSAATTLSDAIKIFSNNCHPITSIESEKLAAYIEDGFDATVLIYAINKAVLSGARNMAYIDGILKRLRTAGILTMQAVEAAERDYQDKKAGKKTETVRGGNEYIPEKPPDAEQMAKNQEFMRGLLGSIGKGMN